MTTMMRVCNKRTKLMVFIYNEFGFVFTLVGQSACRKLSIVHDSVCGQEENESTEF